MVTYLSEINIVQLLSMGGFFKGSALICCGEAIIRECLRKRYVFEQVAHLGGLVAHH